MKLLFLLSPSIEKVSVSDMTKKDIVFTCSNHSSLKIIYQELNFQVLYQIFNKVKFSNQINFGEEEEVDIYVSETTLKR